MEFRTLVKEPFCVIGKEIYTWDGDGMIPKVWSVVDSKFDEIDPVICKDENGKPLAKWGAMSSKKRDFSMWEENGSVGLYLAGYEAPLDAKAPAGWTKWIVPGFEFRLGKIEGEGYFYRAFDELTSMGLPPVAATENWIDIETGEFYFAFPVKRL
ncbi:MAG: AraC family transcriptional regulator [Firmicutes bacterium]|nr:AraC family transcriptional regulator [Bacillota bacterium]MBR3719742.1 AraC family transcriptional regulator [Bacillota bacterium]